MPINANLLGAMARPVRSVADYQDDYMRRDIQQQGMQRNALLLQEGQALQQDRVRTRQDGDTLRNALSMLPPGATHEQRIRAMEGTNLPGGYMQADALRKSIAQQAKDAASVAKDNEETAGKAQERGIKGDHQARLLLQSAKNPTMAADMVRSAVDRGLWTQERAMSVLDGMPIDLTQWDEWRNRQLAPAQAPKDLLPRQGVNNSGGFDSFYSQDPLTGAVTVNSKTARQQTPDSVAGERTAAAGRRQSQSQFDTRLEYDKNKDSNPTAGGKAPPGYRFTQGGNLEAIPGGPADRKNTDAGIRETRSREAAVAQADRVITKVDQALGDVGLMTSGPGAILSGIPGTSARNLQSTLETIKANLGFAELQAMRDASPTGGALGAIAVQELTALQSTVASLDQGQSPAQLEKSLGDIKKHYGNWKDAVSGKAKPPKADATGAGGNSVTTPDGRVHTFPNAAAAAQFKKAAGL